MIILSPARIVAWFVCAGSLALVACGGAEAAGGTPDASPGSDAGPDSVSDSKVADAPVDAPPVDSPLARVPKEHRPAATTCAPSKSTGSSACATAGGPVGACKKDGDCTAGTNGHCAPSGGGVFMCACSYDTCVGDSECTSGGPCACAGSPYQYESNGCAPSGNCKVDADCGASGYCSPSGGAGCSGSLAGYFCHGPSDECVDTEDCKGTSGPSACTYDATKKHWACTPILACA